MTTMMIQMGGAAAAVVVEGAFLVVSALVEARASNEALESR